jgi:hypothetical protein
MKCSKNIEILAQQGLIQQKHEMKIIDEWFLDYSSDGSTLNNKLIRNTEAAAFAVKRNFTTPIYAVGNDNDERLKHI